MNEKRFIFEYREEKAVGSISGTFNDNLNNQNLSVAVKEKESINAILAYYIMLGPE